MPRRLNRRHGLPALGAIALLAMLAIPLIRDPGNEARGYWFFARVLWETGGMVNPGRSPLYVLYLLPFWGLGFPFGYLLERIVTLTLAGGAIALFARRFVGGKMAVFAAVLWLPFIAASPPPTQPLCLALCCLALVLRGKDTRGPGSWSYALLVGAALLRTTFILLILLFIMLDLYRLWRQHRLKNLLPRREDLPLGLALLLAVALSASPSTHRWNNAQFATARWMPGAAHGLTNAAFIQGQNWKYIESRYGTFEGHDFYFTNQELFAGAETLPAAVQANPKFVIRQIWRNLLELPYHSVLITMLPKLLGFVPHAHAAAFLVLFTFTLFAWRTWSPDEFLFYTGCVAVISTTALVLAKTRYFIPWIPVLIAIAASLGARLRDKLHAKGSRLGAAAAMPLSLLLLSDGGLRWPAIAQEAVRDPGSLTVIRKKPSSRNIPYQELRRLAHGCGGILSQEILFFGAFLDVPIERLYDPWEIPPFGHLGDPGYAGLRPERIDCVFESQAMVEIIGSATNLRLRYDGHIRPYIDHLIELGAEVTMLPNYGRVVRLKPAAAKRPADR
ncbi:MAG: hypothetical protein ABIJ96_13805 [Elusimicrobiota bacterium]